MVPQWCPGSAAEMSGAALAVILGVDRVLCVSKLFISAKAF
jgi:hypothetical protein